MNKVTFLFKVPPNSATIEIVLLEMQHWQVNYCILMIRFKGLCALCAV